MLANTKNRIINRQMHFSPFAKTWIKPITLATFSKLTSLTKKITFHLNPCVATHLINTQLNDNYSNTKLLEYNDASTHHLSQKKSSTSIFLQKKNQAPHYFFREKSSASFFLQTKIERLIISSEKNHFFLKK